MQEKSIQLKHVNTKSLHEINFLHNERLDSVFMQPHMQTYMRLFLSTTVWPSVRRCWSQGDSHRGGYCESMMQVKQTHDSDWPALRQTIKRSMIRHVH